MSESEQKYPSISLCMIARDEEDWIAQAITSVAPIVSEVIVIDTGSTDKTVQIAKDLGAKVYFRAWDDDFSAPRNLSLQLATGDWILVLDSDEAIAKEDLATLQQYTLDRSCCYEFPQRHYTNDQRLSDFIPAKGEKPEWERNYGGYFESRLIRLFPNRVGIHYIGRIHELVEHSIRQIGKFKEVKSEVRIQHYGHTPEVRNKKNKAAIYTPLGQEKLKDNPKDWKAFFELGVEHNCNGRYAESVDAFLKAIEMNPKYVASWLNIGYVLCELGRFDEAVVALETSLSLDPRTFEAHCNLGVVYLRTQKFALSERHLLTAINMAPEYVNAYLNLGKALVYQGRSSEAVHFYKRALELMPNCTGAMADLGSIYLGHKIYDQAEKYLKAACTNDPNLYMLQYQLGSLFKATNRASEALQALEKFCELEKLEPAAQLPLETASMIESVKIDCELLRRELGTSQSFFAAKA